MKPTQNYQIIKPTPLAEEEDGFLVSRDEFYERANSGEVIEGTLKGKTVFYYEFKGVELEDNLIAVHQDDIVAYKNKEKA